GKISTPTPQLSALATGVILNPWWEVPKSIEKDVRGKRGYVPVRSADGKSIVRWRQPPGPSNALGQAKFVMWNPKAIYLHDTNARGLFDTKARAYSHGCIRTEHVLALATKLLTEGGVAAAPAVDGATGTAAAPAPVQWTAQKIAAALASKKAVPANFPKPLPVYIVYMSSAALVDGSIKDYTDIYKRDGKVIAALLDKKPASGTAVAAR
ncbi:MAG: L,D-transpeptidase family protein, partial [Sphingomicrobium sp.]